MRKISTTIEQRPHYYRGQLLLENDFLAEQKYHIDARRRHNVHVHGWGVVRGLTVERQGDQAITVNSGVALDEVGNEIPLDDAQYVELSEFQPGDRLQVSLTYEEASIAEDNSGQRHNQRECYAVVTVSEGPTERLAVPLATVQLDGQGHISEDGISYAQTQYARPIAPGSITPNELHDSLRKGWLRLPFRPMPLVNVPAGEEEIPPAFRVGATEALSPAPETADARDAGAAGTMAIPIPPSVRHVTQLRIAGLRNEGEIHLQLVVGGWDPTNNTHMRKMLIDTRIPSEQPYMRTFAIEAADSELDPEYHTLSLWVRGSRRTSVSLVALEFVY